MGLGGVAGYIRIWGLGFEFGLVVEAADLLAGFGAAMRIHSFNPRL